jgi:catechol 2,3-dioxygenase-like lactoylglutathione lyase family enzyme
MMVDHVGFAVRNYDRSKPFHEKALAPIGLTLMKERAGERPQDSGREVKPSFWIEARGEPVRGRLHIARAADGLAQVDAFHAAAVEAGGTDIGAPRVRKIYHPDYCAAYVLDPDGLASNVVSMGFEPGG